MNTDRYECSDELTAIDTMLSFSKCDDSNKFTFYTLSVIFLELNSGRSQAFFTSKLPTPKRK